MARRLILTEADFCIFEALDRHGPLPTPYLYEFSRHLRRDYTHLQNRLTDFYNGDTGGQYLVRPPQQFAAYEARYQHVVYGLAHRARVALAERGTLTRYGRRRAVPFVHQLMSACVGASLEIGAAAQGLRYISRNEILTHPNAEPARNASDPMAIPISGIERRALVPDDLFGLEYPGTGFRFFAVEIDRNTESIERRNLAQSAFGRKISGYAAVLNARAYKSWWGVPNLHVFTVTTNATHARNILAHIGRYAANHVHRFTVSTEPTFGSNWRVPRALLSQLIALAGRKPEGHRRASNSGAAS